MEMDFKHFSHQHPLVFTENQSGGSTEIECFACGELLLDRPSYGCVECDFYLHKTCAQLSRKINHPIHREHPLILVAFLGQNSFYYCRLCRKGRRGFVYCCSSCPFSLHIKCALFLQSDDDGDFPEVQHFCHNHRLINIEIQGNELKKFPCNLCRQPLLDSVYICLDCSLYHHKKCVDQLRPEIHHPFHPKHPLKFVDINIRSSFHSNSFCNFCKENNHSFAYECSSCNFKIHMECALLPQFLTGDFVERQHHSHQKHPLLFIKNHSNELQYADCSICAETLYGPIYACLDCWFYLHKNCAELDDLPLEINHPCHRKHPLALSTSPIDIPPLDCNICKKLCRGFLYHCSLCKFHLHTECVFLTPVIHDKNHHKHPFTLLLSRHPFICDACGTEGGYAPYICTECNLVLHKDCISLQRNIRFRRHEHQLSHMYYLQSSDSRQWECGICQEEVNTDYGSYYCYDCNDYIVHVNCVKSNSNYIASYDPSEKLAALPEGSMDSTACVHYEEAKQTAIEIRHFSHQHILKLSDQIKNDEDEQHCCEACVLPIESSFYSCLECNFFLHKTCAMIPEKKDYWNHRHMLTLCSEGIFICEFCRHWYSGFYYTCAYKESFCIRCITISDKLELQAHEHSLIYSKESLQCIACGKSKISGIYRCMACNFNLGIDCITQPKTARHKYDKHLLKLTYHDDDEDPERWVCLICEEERDPNHWFYSCWDCDFAAHPKCVLGNYPFIKRGTSFRSKAHLHPLTFQNGGNYVICSDCGGRCRDIVLKCSEPGCEYTVHWQCDKRNRRRQLCMSLSSFHKYSKYS